MDFLWSSVYLYDVMGDVSSPDQTLQDLTIANSRLNSYTAVDMYLLCFNVTRWFICYICYMCTIIPGYTRTFPAFIFYLTVNRLYYHTINVINEPKEILGTVLSFSGTYLLYGSVCTCMGNGTERIARTCALLWQTGIWVSCICDWASTRVGTQYHEVCNISAKRWTMSGAGMYIILKGYTSLMSNVSIRL
jgi:hypothetical protein